MTQGCGLHRTGLQPVPHRVAASITWGCGTWGFGSDLDAQEGHAQRADAQLLRRRTRMLHHALRRAALGTQRLGGQRRRIGDFGRARLPRSLPLGPERLGGSPRVRRAARGPTSQPQEARVASCGTARALEHGAARSPAAASCPPRQGVGCPRSTSQSSARPHRQPTRVPPPRARRGPSTWLGLDLG